LCYSSQVFNQLRFLFSSFTIINHISPFAPQQTPLPPNTTTNMPSDLDTLLDMGFDKERAEIAVKKTGGREFCCLTNICPC
jgi:hypothetical protein